MDRGVVSGQFSFTKYARLNVNIDWFLLVELDTEHNPDTQ